MFISLKVDTPRELTSPTKFADTSSIFNISTVKEEPLSILLCFLFSIETVSSYNGSSVFGGKNNLIYEFFLPFRNLHRVVIGTQTQFIFDVLPGASRWSPRSRLHSLLKCLTFLGDSIHRFIFSYLNQLPSSMLVLQHFHQRISIFIIQIFIPMIFASKIALDIH